VEILSEKACGAKLVDKPKFKAQEIENLGKALDFIWNDCGVVVKLKPSAENLHDGDEPAVLGLIWALMMKYLKFAQEDDENLSPKVCRPARPTISPSPPRADRRAPAPPARRKPCCAGSTSTLPATRTPKSPTSPKTSTTA
jgi:hypothetical protein